MRYFLLYTVFTTLLATVGASAGQQKTIDGVLHVMNDQHPENGVETLELEELWRVGGDDEDSVLFGVITKALIDDQNTIYLLDSQLAQVQVFSADGTYLRTIGGRGEGPGEFNLPTDIVFLPNGNLGIIDAFPGRVQEMTLDGTPVRSWIPGRPDGIGAGGGRVVLYNCFGNGNDLVMTGQDISTNTSTGMQERTYFIARYDAEGRERVRYNASLRTWDFGRITVDEALIDYVWSRCGLMPDGRVVVNIPRTDYQLSVFNSDGSLDRIIERPYDSWDRNNKARARYLGWLQGLAGQFPPGSPLKMCDQEPDILNLFVTDDEQIWTLTSRASWQAKPGVLASYDVFSPEGDFLKQVQILCEGQADSDLLLFGAGDLVFRITGYAEAFLNLTTEGGMTTGENADAMEVVCYRKQ